MNTMSQVALFILRHFNVTFFHVLLTVHLSIILYVAVRCTGQPPTVCDDTICCITQFLPPEDEHNSARNM